VPDPFIFALLLTALSLLLGLALFTPAEGAEMPGLTAQLGLMIDGWSAEFFKTGLLAFAFQMCLVLVTGHALALSKPVQRGILALASIPKTTAGAAVLVGYISAVSGVVHWGLGAVVGAFLAREIGRIARNEGRELHYPLLGAAAYLGLLVWHGGFSGSAPLKVAEDGHFLASIIGVVGADQTILSPLNLIVTGVLVVGTPLLFLLMAPAAGEPVVPFHASGIGTDPTDSQEQRAEGPAGTLENSRLISIVLGGAGLIWTIWELAGPARLNLNTVNFLFLFAGILAQGTPIRYVRAVQDGVKGCGGIVLQFPFYFGILGILKASGLIALFADALANMATESTLGIFAFVSAAVVNLFVPSGGGQWAVQGDVLMAASERLGSDTGSTIMAFAYGDQLTNMLQPFWALPLLGITGLKARQIVGYTATVMILVTPVIMLLLYLF